MHIWIWVSNGRFKNPEPIQPGPMPYISVEEHLPGITGLLEYRKDSAQPLTKKWASVWPGKGMFFQQQYKKSSVFNIIFR